MGVHDGHRTRKKRQFLRSGPDSFADHELLELALFYAIPRRDVNGTAHELLERFGSLSGVLEADVEELRRVSGVGDSAAVLLKLLTAVSLRADCADLGGQIISSTEEAGQYFVRRLDGERREHLYLMCLDGKGKVLSCRCLSSGSANMTSASVLLWARTRVGRWIFSITLAAVILAHNHPSGIALPSRADQQMTQQVVDALAPLGIRLLDHIVVADGDFVSMADSGIITR